jgi:hypothetical protein
VRSAAYLRNSSCVWKLWCGNISAGFEWTTTGSRYVKYAALSHQSAIWNKQCNFYCVTLTHNPKLRSCCVFWKSNTVSVAVAHMLSFWLMKIYTDIHHTNLFCVRCTHQTLVSWKSTTVHKSMIWGVFRNDLDSSHLQELLLFLGWILTTASLTHSPPKSKHSCHLFGCFWMVPQNH